MRILAQLALCCLFAGGAMAQRGGGHGGGGGGIGGHGGGGFGGGIGRGGIGGYGGYGRLGYGGLYGGFGWGGYWPYYGLGYDYWPGYSKPYEYYPYSGYPYVTPGYGSADYNAAPTVVYPQTSTYTAHPVMHEYDQYGQEVKPADAGTVSSGPVITIPATSGPASSGGGGSPVYLIAFQDHTIQAAVAYWVDGKTLHYVTLRHAEKQAPLDAVDRAFSQQLNSERRVQFQLPAQ
jgi:hypothetical protein